MPQEHIVNDQLKWKLKDTLITIATAGNIVLLLASLLGLMRWMTAVEARLAAVEKTDEFLMQRQNEVIKWKEDSQAKWKEHDAVETERMKNKR